MTKNNTFKYMNTVMAAAVVVSGGAIVAPNATEASQTYSDVKESDYFYKAVMDLTERGVINGYPGGKYVPEQNVTRGEVAKILANALNLDTENVKDPKFTDVPTSHPYYKEIAALENAGYIKGFEDHSYRSTEQISRNHMALIIAEAYGLDTNTSTKIPFTDLKDLYKDAITALYSNEVTKGMSETTFGGDSKVTRGQIAEFVVRAEKANNPTVVVSEVTETSIRTNKGNYAFSTELASIFAADNAAALKDAEMKIQLKDGKLVKIQSLTLNAAGTETAPVVFDGGNAVVNGNVTVDADNVSLKNLKINGNVILSEQVKTNFATEGLEITGEIVVADEAQAPVAAVKLFALASTNNVNHAKLNLNNTTVKALDVKRNNLEIISNTKLPEVKLAQNVSTMVLNSQVGQVTVNHETLQITGSGSIDKVNVTQSGELTLGLTGNVGELTVANNESKITLGENVTVEKVVVPTGSDVSQMFTDYDAVKGNITEVVEAADESEEETEVTPENPGSGEETEVTPENPGSEEETEVTPENPGTDDGTEVTPENPGSEDGTEVTPENPGNEVVPGEEVDPSVVEVSTIEALREALLDEQIQTINLTGNIENVTERIAIERTVEINGNGHIISFTGDVNSAAYGTRQGIVVKADDVVINDLTVEMTAEEGWQGAYAVQVYDAQNVTLNNFTGSGADAALMVNAADVELTGTTIVSGNEFGGIEVSKGAEEGIENSNLVVSGTIANVDEAYGEPTIWLVHNQDTAKTAQGTVSGEGISDMVINYLDKDDVYQTQYYLQAAPIQTLNAVKLDGDTFKIEVSAESAENLYELEVDHNIADLPEFSVYADAVNPYGSDAAQAQFEALGVTVEYDAVAKKWTIDFGTEVSAQLAAQEKPTFFFVAADQKDFTFGSMFNTTPANTFTF